MSSSLLSRVVFHQPHNRTVVICNWRLKYTRRNEQKRVKDTVANFLKKRHKLKSKFYDAPVTKTSPVTSIQLSGGKLKPQINKNILLRERTVRAVLIREIQEIIDSDQVSQELQTLGVHITSVAMNSKHSAAVFWESLGAEQDIHIQELLNRDSGLIRHILMHNHVIGQVPRLRFVVDASMAVANKLEKIFSELKLDEPSPIEEETQKSSRKIFSTIALTPSERIFGIDHNLLNKKVVLSKQANVTHLDCQSLPPKGILLSTNKGDS